jgi:hypothetical protein
MSRHLLSAQGAPAKDKGVKTRENWKMSFTIREEN